LSALRRFRAAYVGEQADGRPADEAPFWREFEAEDIAHALEQANGALGAGEVCVGVWHREYVMEASELGELLARIAGAGFLGRLLDRARFACSTQIGVSHEGVRVAGSEDSRRALSSASRDHELLGDVAASLRALESTKEVIG
jgi:hypothetical protein